MSFALDTCPFIQSHNQTGRLDVGVGMLCSLVGRFTARDVLGRSPVQRGIGGVTKDIVPCLGCR